MKKLVSLVLALIMLVSVAAASAEPIKITVFHYMTQTTKSQGLIDIENKFVEANPDVELEFVNLVYNQGTDFWPQLETAISTGESPEIIMGNPGLYANLIEEGYVADLTDNAVIKELGLTDGDMGDVSYKGVWRAYPVDFKSWGVFYNTKIFEELKLEIPKTHSELLAVCEVLKANGITPFAGWYNDGASVDIEVRPVIWTKALANGDNDMFEKLMNGEKKVADYPYFAEALQVWGERMKGNFDASNATSNGQTQGNELFLTGQAAMLYQGTWNIGTLESLKPEGFEYSFFLCPMDDTGADPILNVQVDQAFMVNPKAENAEWGYKFMEYWLTDCMGLWSDASLQPCITGAKTENTPPLLMALLDAKASGNTACYGDFTMPFSSAFTAAYRKALNAWAVYCITGETVSGVNSIETALDYMQQLFDDEIAAASL